MFILVISIIPTRQTRSTSLCLSTQVLRMNCELHLSQTFAKQKQLGIRIPYCVSPLGVNEI